jgi:predicted RNase H-like HicB family nuclease
MRTFSAVIERDPDTGLFVGFVPGFAGAHSQGATLDELNANLREVITMLLEDGEPVLESFGSPWSSPPDETICKDLEIPEV